MSARGQGAARVPRVVPPVTVAKLPDGSGEYFIDANGLAWLADRTRMPELDAVRASPCPACGERVEVEAPVRDGRRSDVEACEEIFDVICGADYSKADEIMERIRAILRDAPPAAPMLDAGEVARVLAVLRDVNSDRLALLAWLSKMPDVPESWATTPQIDKFHRLMRKWMTGDVQTQVAHLAIARQDERAASIAALNLSAAFAAECAKGGRS